MAGVHVTLANWYDLYYNLTNITWGQLSPDVHAQLLGHQGLIAAIIRTRTYRFLEQQDQTGDEAVEVDDAASSSVTATASTASFSGPSAPLEDLAPSLEDDLDARATAGLFDDDDLQFVDPDEPQEIIQRLQQSVVVMRDSTRVSIRGVRYFATPLQSLRSSKMVMNCRSVVRYVEGMPSGNVATGVGVVVAISHGEHDQPSAHVVPLPYLLTHAGFPLIPRLGLHSVLLPPLLEADQVAVVPCCQLLNPVVLDPHPDSHRRYDDGTLICFALNVNAERYFQ
jgi:hypothetical protein